MVYIFFIAAIDDRLPSGNESWRGMIMFQRGWRCRVDFVVKLVLMVSNRWGSPDINGNSEDARTIKIDILRSNRPKRLKERLAIS
jgi:hypothetical protein